MTTKMDHTETTTAMATTPTSVDVLTINGGADQFSWNECTMKWEWMKNLLNTEESEKKNI